MRVKRCSDLSSSAPVKVEDSICTRWVNGSTVIPPVKFRPVTKVTDDPSLGLNETMVGAPDTSKRPSLLKAKSSEPKLVAGPAKGVGGTGVPAESNCDIRFWKSG